MNQRKDTDYYRRRVCCYALFIAQGGFLFGFGLTETVSILFFSRKAQSTNVDIYSVAAPLGAVFGSFSGYWLIGYGRRRTAILAALGFAVSLILALLPIQSAEYHLIPKFIQGLAVGYESFICPLFIYEISPLRQRGQLMGLQQMMITFGVFYAQLMQIWFKSYGWYNIEEGKINFKQIGFPQNLVYSVGVFGLPLLLCFIIICVFKLFYKRQTPQWYLEQQDFSQVRFALGYIYMPQVLHTQTQNLVNEAKIFSEVASTSVMELKRQRRNKGFCVASVVLILQMLVGINAILLKLVQVVGNNNETNSMDIKEQSAKYHITQKDKSFLNIIITVVNAISLLLFIFIFHKISRKLMLLGGLLLMASCEYSVICFTSSSVQQTSYQFTYALSCFFVFAFQLSIGPIAWIQVHQILEPKLAAIATSLNWFFNFLVTLFTILFSAQLTFLILFFSTSCIVGSVFLIMYYPETNYKTKAQIYQQLVRGVSPSLKNTSILSHGHQQELSRFE